MEWITLDCSKQLKTFTELQSTQLNQKERLDNYKEKISLLKIAILKRVPNLV